MKTDSLRKRFLTAIRVYALMALCAYPALPEETYGKFGIAIKTGEAAGGLGSQVSYNISRHWQATVGVGGISLLSFSALGTQMRTDSYFILGKYYFNHLYISSGYSLKITKVETEVNGFFYRASRANNGIPFHLGYEFGDREGMFFAASIGGLFVPINGGKNVVAGPDGQTSYLTSANSGPSIGLSLGYYIP